MFFYLMNLYSPLPGKNCYVKVILFREPRVSQQTFKLLKKNDSQNLNSFHTFFHKKYRVNYLSNCYIYCMCSLNYFQLVLSDKVFECTECFYKKNKYLK